MDNNQQAIYKTLVYSSLFSFPLTQEELYRYLIAPKPLAHNVFLQSLENLQRQKFVLKKNGYYMLVDCKAKMVARTEMAEILDEKMQQARKIARILSFVPTIYLLGLSGALAAGNASADDDIDFFIITKKSTLFSTRLLTLLLVQFLGKRRRYKDKQVANKVCLNLWIDTSRLLIPKSEQDLYTARELVQLKPLFSRNNTYEELVSANKWITAYLPHAQFHVLSASISKKKRLLLENSVATLEPLAKIVQKFVMNKHHTTEIIADNYLAFYPADFRKKILERYFQEVKKRAKLL